MELRVEVQHKTDTVRGEARGQSVYHGRCTCGWLSSWYAYSVNARRDQKQHLEAHPEPHVDDVDW